MNKDITILQQAAIELLKELIAVPSFSKEEERTASTIEKFLTARNITVTRVGNNIIALNKHYDKNKPTILLNSHHDTVKPNPQYTKDPFSPVVESLSERLVWSQAWEPKPFDTRPRRQ